LKKKVMWVSLLIVLEVFLTMFAQLNSTFPINSNNKQILYFVIPILLICTVFFIFFVLTLLNNNFSERVLVAVFEEKKLPFVFVSALTAFLLLCSLIYFTINDSFLPEISSIYSPYATLGYILFWETIILFSYTREEFKDKPKYWIGLPILLAINYYLWHTLVNVGDYLEPYFPQVYTNRYEHVFSTYKWWQLLLPIKEFGGFWAGGSVLIYFTEKIVGTAGVWYLYQAILILTSFFLSWRVFRSEIFSYIIAICLVFGTHYYQAFIYSSIIMLYLLQTFYILLLYFAYEFIRSPKKYSWHLLALVVTLILTVLMTEGWLDFFASVWAMSIFLFFYLKKIKQTKYSKKLFFVFLIFNIFAGIYIYVKLTYIGFIHESGESKVIFTYGIEYFWRAVEDFISNYFTNLYTTITNFLPPAFITSNSLYQYKGIHEQKNNLILGHYVFFWRYAAGVTATLFYVFLMNVVKKVFKENKFSLLFPLVLFLIMVAVNSPTHNIVVYLPFKAMPLIGYYVGQGILGLSLCIAYMFHVFNLRTDNKKIVILVSILMVLIILYSSIRRPNYLWQMIESVGLAHQGPYPNPLAVAIIKIRILFPGFLGN